MIAAVEPAYAAHPFDRWAEQLGIDQDVSYDGTRMMVFQKHKMPIVERRAPGKMYTEMQMQGMNAGVIIREDLGKSFILMPTMGFYREESLQGGMMQAASGMEFSNIERVGAEQVNGFPCTKYKAKFKDREGKGAGFIWVTDSGVPIKLDMLYSNNQLKGQRFTSEFVELHLREQDPSHFEVPANLQPMGMGGMMKGIFGGNRR